MKKHTYIDSSDLKTILHSKRANLYYLEHCRVLVSGGRVEYVATKGRESLYYNIPIANTTCIMLGIGTSITQAAVRDLAKAGVMVGFCGNGGTPLISGSEYEIACEFLSPQSEYRPTEYLQKWCHFWFDDDKRLRVAQKLQLIRLALTEKYWRLHRWPIDLERLTKEVSRHRQAILTAENTQVLLLAEGRLAKTLYRLASEATIRESFTRDNRSKEGLIKSPANRFLDHGNYLAYGLGATACWVLGLPHGLSVLHGKTRRGGLVFDTADIIKDGIVLPLAFIAAAEGLNEQAFRETLIEQFLRFNALDTMIETLEALALEANSLDVKALEAFTLESTLKKEAATGLEEEP